MAAIAAAARSLRRSAIRPREWLVTNGLGGYASGTVLGARHAPLPRPARRGASPHRSAALVMLTASTSGSRRRSRRVHLGGADLDGRLRSETPDVALVEFRLELGLPCGAIEVDGSRAREADPDAARPEHRVRHVPAARRRRSVRAGAAARSLHVPPSRERRSTQAARRIRLRVVRRRRHEIAGSRTRRICAALRLRASAAVRRSPEAQLRELALPHRARARGYESRGALLQPRLLRGRAAAQVDAARWSRPTEPWRVARGADARAGCSTRSGDASSGAAQRRAPAPAREGLGRASWCWPPISS